MANGYSWEIALFDENGNQVVRFLESDLEDVIGGQASSLRLAWDHLTDLLLKRESVYRFVVEQHIDGVQWQVRDRKSGRTVRTDSEQSAESVASALTAKFLP